MLFLSIMLESKGHILCICINAIAVIVFVFAYYFSLE